MRVSGKVGVDFGKQAIAWIYQDGSNFFGRDFRIPSEAVAK
jgi:hypothetical protein